MNASRGFFRGIVNYKNAIGVPLNRDVQETNFKSDTDPFVKQTRMRETIREARIPDRGLPEAMPTRTWQL